MLPFKQNKIVEIIKSSGFKANEFNFSPIDNDSFLLKYKPNEDYHLEIKNNKHYIKPAMTGRLFAEGETPSFETALTIVEYWLKAVKENIEVGNPWEDIEDAKEQMNEMNFDSYEEVFNEEEQSKIEKKLDQLLLEITKLNIDTTEIKKDIIHLNTMSGKVSKKDWILLLMGTVTSWVFGSLLSPENTQTIWECVKNLFSGFKHKLIA